MSVGVFNAETNETREVANKSRTAIIDSEMSEESQNPLQNRVITQKITELNQSIEELNTLLNGMDETLGGKLDVSKIANNLVTTEEGYALDARMGKALSDMFLARAIPFTILDTRFSIEYGGIYRIANICFINILIRITSEMPLNVNVDIINGIPYSAISIGAALSVIEYTNDTNDGSFVLEYLGNIRCKFKRNNVAYLISGSYIIKED